MKWTGRKKEEIVYYKPIVSLAQMMEVQAIPLTVTLYSYSDIFLVPTRTVFY